MSRWLVTGAGGMLGRDLVTLLDRRGESVTALDRSGLDVTDAAAVADVLAGLRPDVVVNCAAWTAVDDAEAHEEQALMVNGTGAANLAAACAAVQARLVQPSTDYVFAGTSERPYAEDDIPAPRSAYGRTKLAAERAVLGRLPGAGYVVRTAWLYGAHGPSFVRTMINLERPASDRRRGRRPARPAHLDRRGGRADHGPGSFDGQSWHLPRHQFRADHVVRAGPRNLPAARRRSGPGQTDP